MKNKKFDCVEMKRRGAEAILEETKGMSDEEKLAYWARSTAEARKEQRQLREALRREASAG